MFEFAVTSSGTAGDVVPGLGLGDCGSKQARRACGKYRGKCKQFETHTGIS